MSGVPASSRGTTFNGGTITQPLVIATTDGNVVPFSILASWNAQNQDFFNIINADNSRAMVEVDSIGNLSVLDHATSALAGEIGSGAVQTPIALVSSQVGLFGHGQATQPTLTSGTATPEQIALALQSYGAAGGS